LNEKSPFDDLQPEVQELIQHAIQEVAEREPDFREGDYDPIFDLARRLVFIIGENPSAGLLRDIAKRYNSADSDCTLIGAELIRELRRKMRAVKHPKRGLMDVAFATRWEARLPEEIVELGDPRISALAGFIICLQQLRGDGRVILAQTPIAKLFGMSQPTLSRLLLLLIDLGYLQRVKSSDINQAAEYRWVNDS